MKLEVFTGFFCGELASPSLLAWNFGRCLELRSMRSPTHTEGCEDVQGYPLACHQPAKEIKRPSDWPLPPGRLSHIFFPGTCGRVDPMIKLHQTLNICIHLSIRCIDVRNTWCRMV